MDGVHGVRLASRVGGLDVIVGRGARRLGIGGGRCGRRCKTGTSLSGLAKVGSFRRRGSAELLVVGGNGNVGGDARGNQALGVGPFALVNVLSAFDPAVSSVASTVTGHSHGPSLLLGLGNHAGNKLVNSDLVNVVREDFVRAAGRVGPFPCVWGSHSTAETFHGLGVVFLPVPGVQIPKEHLETEL